MEWAQVFAGRPDSETVRPVESPGPDYNFSIYFVFSVSDTKYLRTILKVLVLRRGATLANGRLQDEEEYSRPPLIPPGWRCACCGKNIGFNIRYSPRVWINNNQLIDTPRIVMIGVMIYL